MAIQIIRDSKNNIIGRIDENASIIRAYDRDNKLVGTYTPGVDITRDGRNNFFCRGNRVASLIR